MSKCTDCEVSLTAENAYKKENRLLSRCKNCFNQYCMKRWIQRKQDAIKKLGGECTDCKQSFPYQVYDFHHLDPSKKDFSWNKMRLQTQTTLDAELAKCILLCANCHRLRHSSEDI